MKRYQAEGIEGLQLKPGRGRKSILQPETDWEAVRRAVESNRQCIALAKADLEKELDKEFSALTLKRFLKKMVTVSNACQSE